MSARTEILARLRRRQEAASMPGPWTSRRQFADLAGRFTQALTAVHGEVHHTDHLHGALDRLDGLLQDLNARQAVANGEPPLSGADLPQRRPDIEWHIVGRTAGDLRAFCADADVGLSGADAALAETGSLVIRSGPGRSRLATLLPPVHIALLPTSRLATDIFTWTATRPAAFPANLVLVSGPSKTADIEQTMAIGVHGPKRLIVILYND